MKQLLFAIVCFLWVAPAWAQQLQCYSYGQKYSTTAAGGHEDSAVVSTAPGFFCQAAVTNNTSAAVYAMVFDASALPANATKPMTEWVVAAKTTTGWWGYPLQMITGTVIACSSTEGTLTVTTSSACNFEVKLSK